MVSETTDPSYSWASAVSFFQHRGIEENPKPQRGRKCPDYTEWHSQAHLPAALPVGGAKRAGWRLGSERSPWARLFCLFNQHLQLPADILETKPKALKRQSEHCASEPLGIFRAGPEQWRQHWTLIFQREGLCGQTWLSGRLGCWKALMWVLPVWASLTPVENSLLYGSSIYWCGESKYGPSRRILLNVRDSQKSQLGAGGHEGEAGTGQQPHSGSWAHPSFLFFKWAESWRCFLNRKH